MAQLGLGSNLSGCRVLILSPRFEEGRSGDGYGPLRLWEPGEGFEPSNPALLGLDR
jgi:hypothetical protein